ncbi:cyclin-J-like [Watersipora subatra]|uniref:cyclin-J-like n=1 Tax=Watersipora subatra TaxID=2589382 RepID=UPI00355BE5E3
MLPADIADDYYHTLLGLEKKIPVLMFRSPQTESRPPLIDWLIMASNFFDLHSSSLHLSIALMDTFLDSFIVDSEQLHLLGLSCIQIAAKFEEREVAIPRVKELLELTKKPYSLKLCMKMELAVLSHLKWQVGIPTVAHFCNYYSSQLIDSTDLLLDRPLKPDEVSTVDQLCRDYLSYLINLPLQDINFRRLRPSVVACAVLAAVRQLVSLSPLWPDRLEAKSGISVNSFSGPLQNIVSMYEVAKAAQEQTCHRKRVANQNDDVSLSSGYISGNSPSIASDSIRSPDPSSEIESSSFSPPVSIPTEESKNLLDVGDSVGPKDTFHELCSASPSTSSSSANSCYNPAIQQ